MRSLCAGVTFKTGCKTCLRNLLLYPLTYVRPLALVFAIVVFSCVADQLYDPKIDFCVYHLNGDCCKYSIAVGVIGCGLCLIFLAKDVIYNVMDLSDHLRVKMLITDAIVNGACGLLWSAAFVFTSDQWRKTDISDPLPAAVNNCANAGVAFSFLCTLLWIAIVVVNAILLVRLRKGISIYRSRGGYDQIGDN